MSDQNGHSRIISDFSTIVGGAVRDEQEFIVSGNGHAGLSQRKTAEVLKVVRSSIQKVLDSQFTENERQTIAVEGFQGGSLRKLAKHFANSDRVSKETRQHCLDLLDKAAEFGMQVVIDVMAGIIPPKDDWSSARVEELTVDILALVQQQSERIEAIASRVANVETCLERLEQLPRLETNPSTGTISTDISEPIVKLLLDRLEQVSQQLTVLKKEREQAAAVSGYKTRLQEWVELEMARTKLSLRKFAAALSRCSGESINYGHITRWKTGSFCNELPESSLRAIAAWRSESVHETWNWLNNG